jgi:hypothetical protein
MASAETQFISIFEGCAAPAADDSGAVPTDEGIIDHFLASWAIKVLDVFALTLFNHLDCPSAAWRHGKPGHP